MDAGARSPEHRVRCLPPVTYQGGDERLPFEIDGQRKTVSLKIEGLNRQLVVGLPDRALDLLEIAALVYGIDSAVSRGGPTDRMMGRGWYRGFHIVMPVRDLELWSDPATRQPLEETLMFLSGDRFTFEFEEGAVTPVESKWFDFGLDEGWRADRVVMFSGGLDSFAGALEEIVEQGNRVALVSHFSSSKIAPVQRALRDALVRSLGSDTCRHFPMRIQLAKGSNLERTHRTRSFLFAVLGLVTAIAFGQARPR